MTERQHGEVGLNPQLPARPMHRVRKEAISGVRPDPLPRRRAANRAPDLCRGNKAPLSATEARSHELNRLLATDLIDKSASSGITLMISELENTRPDTDNRWRKPP